jgi:predicted Zn-dependent peptidase
MIKRYYPDFNEDVYILKLKNGMQVHILPKDEPYYSTYVELSVPYGALDLNYRLGDVMHHTPYGTAHFLEHKVFAMPDGDAFTHFSKMGVDANAMTSYNQTSYLFMATEHVMDALDYLLKMIDTPFIHHENVESEKKIIAEELKMYLDDPNVVMHNQLMEHMYLNHPIRYDIGGTLSSIMDITPEVLNHVYRSFYTQANRLLVIAGKVDIKALKQYFKAYEEIHHEKGVIPKTIYPKETIRIPIKYKVETKDLSIHKLMIGFKLRPKKRSAKEQIKRETAMAMMTNLLLGSSSSMYERLLKEGLINQSFSISTNFEHHAESIVLFAETKKVNQLKRILVDFLTQSGIEELTEEAFWRYQKVYLGQVIYALNHLEHKAYLYGKYYHMGASLFDVVDLLKEISYQDILDAFKELNKKNMSILIYKKA